MCISFPESGRIEPDGGIGPDLEQCAEILLDQLPYMHKHEDAHVGILTEQPLRQLGNDEALPGSGGEIDQRVAATGSPEVKDSLNGLLLVRAKMDHATALSSRSPPKA